MKNGYSLLLGEYFDAEEVEYHDCKVFQITCPSCYEPVFKVARDGASSSVEYLSHYSETKAKPTECELRVKNISNSEKNIHNTKSRDQKLALFLSVFRGMVAQNPIYPNGCDKAQSQLNRSKALKWLKATMFEKQPIMARSNFYQFCDEYVSDIKGVGGVLKTSFSIIMQKRIAFDLWKYLSSAKGRDNYYFLFNHGYLMVMARLNQANETRGRSSDERFLLLKMMDLINGNRKQGMEILTEMSNTTVSAPFAMDGSDFFDKFGAEIMHEMMGALISLPYFEYLKNIERNENH